MEWCWIPIYLQNPVNYGIILLKMSVFKGGSPTHSGSLYLDKEIDDKICICLGDLLTRSETLWVNCDTRVPKTNGVTGIVTPIPAWRKKTHDCKTVGRKRKARDDCIIPEYRKKK